MLRMMLRLACLSVALFVASHAPAADKQPLRVLYCGDPGSPREAEFVAFLNQNFENVATGSFTRFKPSDADNFDVVILDWSRLYTPAGLRLPQRPILPPSYDRPTILVGGAGGTLGGELHLKLDWL